MGTARIAVSLNNELLKALDDFVVSESLPSRSHVIQKAIFQLLENKSGSRLARECAKLDKTEEMKIAEEGMGYELDSWTEY